MGPLSFPSATASAHAARAPASFVNALATPISDRDTIRARYRHENDTVSTRFLHGFYMVFPRLRNHNHLHSQHLRRRKTFVSAPHYGSAKRTHRAALPPPPCLRACVAVCLSASTSRTSAFSMATPAPSS